MTFQVFDDFMPQDDAARVVASAHAAGFGSWRPNKGEVGSSIYDGMCFWGDHALPLRALAGATGSLVIPNATFFRVTNVGMEKAYIHSDRESGAHTCVLYLSEHGNQEAGTAFYRHKPTGLLAMPSFEEMKERGIFDALRADMVSRNPDAWELVDFVRGRYNRALVFPAPLFHSRFPLEGFGDDDRSGRLVWACHFYKMHAANGALY